MPYSDRRQTMSDRPDRTIDAGMLRFHTYYRSSGEDYGPAVGVFAETQPGVWTEVLRYDCFAREPHRHYFRADGREERVGYTGGIAGGVAATTTELGEITSVLEQIGYAEVLRGLSASALQDAIGTVRQELASLGTRAR
jgi:hypothetical protein